ncbi:DUF411 domain-containing protein [Mesorhizobium sp. KR9-304]|uniref:DUF411 domain-containing protein n=1 Tax=Mesorhizobium sp. KR9-304 TaxID=3156614 RepID=UPI0032B31F5F
MKRRTFLSALPLSLAFLVPGVVHGTGQAMTVYKNSWCDCCHGWAEAMRKAGYSVTTVDMDDLSPIRKRAGVPAAMEGCHSAEIGGYFLEGHVPPEAVAKLLAERPDIGGLAVPGMPLGSPGMGDDPKATYEVFALPRDPTAAATVYYRAGEQP